MNNKLVIVTDLGQPKAFSLESAPKYTPRLELLEAMTLEETHHRLGDLVSKEIAHGIVDELALAIRDQLEKWLPCDLTKASTQEIIGHFLDKSISST